MGAFSDVGERFRVDDGHRSREGDRNPAGDCGADADRGDVVAVVRGDRDAVEAADRAGAHARLVLGGAARRGLGALPHEAVRAAGREGRVQRDDLRRTFAFGDFFAFLCGGGGDFFEFPFVRGEFGRFARDVFVAVDEAADGCTAAGAVDDCFPSRERRFAGERVGEFDDVSVYVLGGVKARRVVARGRDRGRADEALRFATVRGRFESFQRYPSFGDARGPEAQLDPVVGDFTARFLDEDHVVDLPDVFVGFRARVAAGVCFAFVVDVLDYFFAFFFDFFG